MFCSFVEVIALEQKSPAGSTALKCLQNPPPPIQRSPPTADTVQMKLLILQLSNSEDLNEGQSHDINNVVK